MEERKNYNPDGEKNIIGNHEQQHTLAVFEQEKSFDDQSINHDFSTISSGNYSRSNKSNEHDSSNKLNISK